MVMSSYWFSKWPSGLSIIWVRFWGSVGFTPQFESRQLQHLVTSGRLSSASGD